MDANTWGAIGSIGQATAGFLSLVVVIVFTIMQFRQTRRFADQSRREADERSEREIEAARKLAFLERQDTARAEAIETVVGHLNSYSTLSAAFVNYREALALRRPIILDDKARIEALRDRVVERLAEVLSELQIDKHRVRRAWGERGAPLIGELEQAMAAAVAIVQGTLDSTTAQPAVDGPRDRAMKLIDALDEAPHWRV